MFKKTLLVVLVAAAALVAYMQFSVLSKENKRLYMALKCAYFNAEFAAKEGKITELQYALLNDLQDAGYSLDNSRGDKALGCFARFGLRGH